MVKPQCTFSKFYRRQKTFYSRLRKDTVLKRSPYSHLALRLESFSYGRWVLAHRIDLCKETILIKITRVVFANDRFIFKTPSRIRVRLLLWYPIFEYLFKSKHHLPQKVALLWRISLSKWHFHDTWRNSLQLHVVRILKICNFNLHSLTFTGMVSKKESSSLLNTFFSLETEGLFVLTFICDNLTSESVYSNNLGDCS